MEAGKFRGVRKGILLKQLSWGEVGVNQKNSIEEKERRSPRKRPTYFEFFSTSLRRLPRSQRARGNESNSQARRWPSKVKEG